MLHYTDTETNGAPIVFVHGVLMNQSVWHIQVPEFARRHRVITLDMAGFGQSAGTGFEDFSDHARQIDALLVHLDLEQVTLVGWSMGGAVAQVMAHEIPARLKRVVLAGTTPQLIADAHFSDALPPEAVGELGGLFAEDFTAGCDAFSAVCAPEDKDTATFLANVMKGTNPERGLASLARGGELTQIGILDQLQIETHVIHETEDAVCLPAAASHLANHIPGCTTAVNWIEGAGHAAFLTCPDAFSQALQETLG